MDYQQSKSQTARRARFVLLTLALTLAVALASWALPWCAANALGGTNTAAEVELKAALIFKFTWFTTWPAHSFDDIDSPLLICVAGNDGLADALVNVVRGRTTGGRTLRVQSIKDDKEEDNCHVLYLGPAANDRIDEMIAAHEGRPTLTISDTTKFCMQGGIINLVRKGRRFSFSIYPDAAERAGLKLSSQLLKLADVFHDHKSSQE